MSEHDAHKRTNALLEQLLDVNQRMLSELKHVRARLTEVERALTSTQGAAQSPGAGQLDPAAGEGGFGAIRPHTDPASASRTHSDDQQTLIASLVARNRTRSGR